MKVAEGGGVGGVNGVCVFNAVNVVNSMVNAGPAGN